MRKFNRIIPNWGHFLNELNVVAIGWVIFQATQECYEFLDLSDVNDTERSQLATTLYPSEKQQAHVSWVYESLQQQQHRYQHQHALGGVANIGSEVITNRVPPQHQQQPQGDASCHQELEHDPAVINSWPEAPYGKNIFFILL